MTACLPAHLAQHMPNSFPAAGSKTLSIDLLESISEPALRNLATQYIQISKINKKRVLTKFGKN